MRIGCLGDIAFEITSDKLFTPGNMKRTGKARYSSHQLHGRKALTEFVGVDPETFTFDMQLSSYLGVNVDSELEKLRAYMNSGKTLPLVIGRKSYGEYRWVITAFTANVKHTDGNGNTIYATVSVTLQEYLRK